jgi:hypothetical protein
MRLKQNKMSREPLGATAFDVFRNTKLRSNSVDDLLVTLQFPYAANRVEYQKDKFRPYGAQR